MKKLILATAVFAMLAGAAFAAPLQSLSKTPVMKDPGNGDPNKGLLDCSGATEIVLDAVYAGTNVGAPNNVTTYGCSTWDESGGEVVFHLYLAEPGMFVVSLEGNGCDLDMAVLDGCDETLNCLIVVDSGVQTNSPVTGDFYFVVDGYNGAECDFTLTTESVALPEPANFCDLVLDATGNYFEGDTCDGVNQVESLGCEVYSEAGLEDYYEVLMPAGSSFTATVTNTADGALWVVDSCLDPIACLAYADDTLSGAAEVISYTNVSGADQVVYLVIDSWGTGSCGTYTMDFAGTGGAVADESTSFSNVKAMFR
jgi:hypothetical protein